MELQRRLAANALKCGENRVKFDPEKLAEIKEAITTFDIHRLINKGIIRKEQIKGISNARSKKIQSQNEKTGKKAKAREKEEKPQEETRRQNG